MITGTDRVHLFYSSESQTTDWYEVNQMGIYPPPSSPPLVLIRLKNNREESNLNIVNNTAQYQFQEIISGRVI